MIFSRNLNERSASVIGDAQDLHALGATTLEPPLGLFDWYLKPHLYSRRDGHSRQRRGDRRRLRRPMAV